MKPVKLTLLGTAIGLALASGSPAIAGPTITSDDGNFKATVGGRIQVDTTWYDEDNVNLDGENGTEFRRARLFVKGTMYDVWNYKAQYDFAGNGTDMKDAYIGYTGFDFAKIKIGQFKQPSSLEELTSSKYITFMERSLPNAFATGRRIGLGASSANKTWTWAASVYGREEGDDTAGDEGYGAGARVTWSPWNEKTKVLHLGAWGAYEDPNDNDVRFRARPESHQTSTRLVDTGNIPDPDEFTRYGVEAAGVFGPFSLQGEYVAANAESNQAGYDDPDLTGWYAYGSWFITGESRKYKKGAFGRVSPSNPVGKGGWGAWELAARYSSIDLEDGDATGGEEDNITIGVNWYATKHVRFMANYIMVDADPVSSRITDIKAGENQDEPNIIQLRAQVDF